MKKGLWIGLVVVVLVLVVVGAVVLFGGESENREMSEDRKVVRDVIYEEYLFVCREAGTGFLSLCEDVSMCVADKMVEYSTEDEIKEIRIMIENRGLIASSSIVKNFYKEADKEIYEKINIGIMACVE